ncbi:MAG: aldehyde dehydrogenase family protein [Rhodobacteraceae bacterium]|nr:aldehyde dehydrogenase family protein [Paracoccaceae bacterium]
MTIHPLGLDPGLCLIGDAWCAADSGDRLPLYNPSDGSVLCEIAAGGAADVDAAVAAAQAAMAGAWGRTTAMERGRILHRMHRLVLDHADELAQLESLDVGKPLKQGHADVVGLARYLEFYAGAADKLHGDTIPYQNGFTVYTLREPHGVAGIIVPWNYPMQIIGRAAGAALAAGNAVVLKPAEEASLTALAFAEIGRRAGLPAGALNLVPGRGPEAGAALARHRGVHHMSFTGSVRVGRLIQQYAAENIVPVTLELGGKSPQIVFGDADLGAALPVLISAGLQNAGQTCSASSRILVHQSRYDEVVEAMAERYRALRVGPASDNPDVGPVVSNRQKGIVEDFLGQGGDLTRAAEADIAADAPNGGAYVRPTLFACDKPDHVLARDEIFGPVQVAIPFSDDEEALAIANGTDYGLVAGCWTMNGPRQMRMAKEIRAGQVYINNYGAGGGIEIPFGGVGLSGHGREKGFEALHGFTRVKAVSNFHG